jgi:hypothetical protein
VGKVTTLPDKKAVRKVREDDTLTSFEHSVDLMKKTGVKQGKREEIRTWFHESNILTYMHWGENAQVMWDKNWRKFYFKDIEIAIQFKLRFG